MLKHFERNVISRILLPMNGLFRTANSITHPYILDQIPYKLVFTNTEKEFFQKKLIKHNRGLLCR